MTEINSIPVSILNYGVGNIASLVNMIQKVGGKSLVCNKPVELKNSRKILLPGVGAFDHAMRLLQDGWAAELNDAVLKRIVPVLGICLGMQLMCNSSEEGALPGLGWIDAEVKRFNLPQDGEFKIPHMGWNPVSVVKSNSLIEMGGVEQRFYFVHSYHAVCKNPEDILATANHGYDFTAAFSRNNISGVQFHPEKSHRFGMALMKKFVELPC